MKKLRPEAAVRFAAAMTVITALVLPAGSIAAVRPPAIAATPTLNAADPFRLTVNTAGTPQTLKIRGTNFEENGHPNRDQYMHWQIRSDDGSWERCARGILNPAATCRTTGWGAGFETFEVGGSYLAREGFVELRVFSGLADDTETDPAKASTLSEWSNVLRIPVVVPGTAPAISSLSKTSFPLTGTPAEYQFLITAAGLDPSAVVVFRGDVVVAPERMYDGKIQVTVPEVYRRSSPGELSLTVRTDKGGNSPLSYIKFAAPAAVQMIQRGPVLGTDLRIPSAGAAGVTARIGGACASGYVWREATSEDHACVTPEARARTAQQNAQAAARRDPSAGAANPAPCKPGYVWRDAVPGDAVCVTPAERTQAAEDTRLAPSHVAR